MWHAIVTLTYFYVPLVSQLFKCAVLCNKGGSTLLLETG